MLRRILAMSTVLVAVYSAAPAPANAQWWQNFWSGVHRDYQRNVAWPDPFLASDRQAVEAPFAIQIANGWRRQNLLSDYHFTEDGLKLNQAGESKLYFILTQMPPNRRTVFVQRSMNPDVTSTRLALVQRTANRMVPMGMMADVVESDLANDGWPADEIDYVSRKFRSTSPDPRLPAPAGNTSSAGGSGN